MYSLRDNDYLDFPEAEPVKVPSSLDTILFRMVVMLTEGVAVIAVVFVNDNENTLDS